MEMKFAPVYPAVRRDIAFRFSPGRVEIINPRRGPSLLPGGGWEILRRCDGRHRLQTLWEQVSEDYEVDPHELSDFLSQAVALRQVELLGSPSPRELSTRGSGSYHFPSIFQLELTTTCNILCTYCYGCYGPDRKEHAPFDKLLGFLEQAERYGAYSIELTGGEPTAHPRFADIFQHVLEHFPLVSVISNGSLWRDRVLDLAERHSGQLTIQISIDGASEETNAKVRQVANTWHKTLKTLERLVSLELAGLRVTYVVTEENVHELRPAAQLMKDMGVTNFGISVADGQGRGAELQYEDGKSLTNWTSEHAEKIYREVSDVNRDFKDICYRPGKSLKESMTPAEYSRKTSNCGAGWRTVHVRANGDLTGCCLMDPGTAVLHNIYRVDDVLEIFDQKASRLMRNFYKDHNDPSCMHCEYNGFCGTCMHKIYEANKNRLAKGLGLCGVAERNRMDEIFDFQQETLYNIGH